MTQGKPRDPAMARWGALTEPMTVVTDLALAAAAFVFGVRLAYAGMASGVVSSSLLGLSLLFTALTAALGAAGHGIDPVVARDQRERVWRGVFYSAGFIGATLIACVGYFVARGAVRSAILAFAVIKLVVYVVNVTRRPEFRVTVADYVGALAVLLAAAVYGFARWRAPSAPWLIGGVLVSLSGGLVTARRLSLHRHFNHNDLYHVIQVVAIYLVYRGGTLLVDR